MSDLISRQEAIDFFKNCYIGLSMSADEAYYKILYTLRTLPSIEPERKTGEWMLYESRSDIYDLEGVCTWGRAYRCSECGFIHWVIEDFGIYSFCPNCGAYMKGRNE